MHVFDYRRAAVVASMLFATLSAWSQSEPRIHLIWMGGNDCPPCMAWRALELPKLRETDAFQRIRFSYVIKPVGGAVPASFFLDAEVRPYKEILDQANSGRGGSPQGALLVNGVLHDYFLGVRSAQEIESMILAVESGEKYPFRRCLKVNSSRSVRQCDLRP
jgi:hypothetical protein